MRCSRVFTDQALQTGSECTLDNDTTHYLFNVLRMRNGFNLSLFNGKGGEYACRIIHIDKKSTIINVGEHIQNNNESGLKITLVQGISRGQKMDYTIQKAVELGVSKIVPVHTEYSNVKLDDERLQNRLKHWQKIIIGACEQSGRNLVPELSPVNQLADWMVSDNCPLKLAFSPDAKHSLQTLKTDAREISILIGPEGGFSDTEYQLISYNKYHLLRLGPRILRTESAATAAICACQTLWGDFSV